MVLLVVAPHRALGTHTRQYSNQHEHRRDRSAQGDCSLEMLDHFGSPGDAATVGAEQDGLGGKQPCYPLVQQTVLARQTFPEVTIRCCVGTWCDSLAFPSPLRAHTYVHVCVLHVLFELMRWADEGF